MSAEKETVQKMLDEAMGEYTALHGHINYLRKKLGLDPLPSVSAEGSQSQGIKPDSFFGHTIGAAIEKYLLTNNGLGYIMMVSTGLEMIRPE